MAPITTVTFTRGRRRYDVRISFDDAAVVDEKLVVEVGARVTEDAGRPIVQTVTVELDLEDRVGRVIHDGEEWFRFRFNDVPTRMSGDGNENPPGMEVGAEDDVDGVAAMVEEGIGRRVADLVDLMPAPDPFLGCALKAGISSVIGQTLTCHEMVGGDGSRRQRIWRVVRCLHDHVGGIVTRTLWRAARCMVLLGFG